MEKEKDKDNENKIIKRKADAFFVLGNVVHITLLDGIWKRGIIKSVDNEKLILDERMQGLMPVFFDEIKRIEGLREEYKHVK